MPTALMPRGVPVPCADEPDGLAAMGELVLKRPSQAQERAVREVRYSHLRKLTLQQEALVWKGGLTIAEYLERCALTDATDFGRATQAKWCDGPLRPS